LPRHTTFDLSAGKDFGERFSASLNAVNVANRRMELDNSQTFGGFHWNEPLEIYVGVSLSAPLLTTDTSTFIGINMGKYVKVRTRYGELMRFVSTLPRAMAEPTPATRKVVARRRNWPWVMTPMGHCHNPAVMCYLPKRVCVGCLPVSCRQLRLITPVAGAATGAATATCSELRTRTSLSLPLAES